MNIAIVDDVEADRAQLIGEIKKCATECAMMIYLTEYKSGEDFLQRSHLSSVDVVFLDIYMGGLNGMDVARKIRHANSSCQIVFVTSSTDFAVQSYEVRALYYIVKPYDYKDISKVIAILDKSIKTSSRYIKVKEGREWCKVLLSEILYVDYRNHYAQIHTESTVISTYIKFTEIEEMLLVYNEFLTCYRCIVVNMNKIKKTDDLFFLLSNGEYIPINRKNARNIKKRYTDYIFDLIDGKARDDD